MKTTCLCAALAASTLIHATLTETAWSGARIDPPAVPVITDAQETRIPSMLPEVVVYAERHPESEALPPANIEVMDSRQIDQLSGDWMNVLNRFRGMTMRSMTSTPVQMEPALRGFGENAQGRLLVLYNGMRLNRPDMASLDWLSIPMDEVSAIELDRGGAAAMYGNYALAGVMQIRTEPATNPYTRVEAGSYGQFSAAAGAGLQEKGHRASVRLREDEGNGYRENSDYHAASMSGDYAIKTNVLRAAFNGSVQDLFYQLPGPLTKAQMQADRRASVNGNDSVQNRQYRAGLSAEAAGEEQSLLLDAGWQRRLIDSCMSSYPSFNAVDLDSGSFSPRWHRSEEEYWDVLIGGDGYYDQLQQTRYEVADFASETGDADVRRMTWAGYAAGGVRLPMALRLKVSGRCEEAVTEADMHSAGERTVDSDETQQGGAWSAELSREWSVARVYVGLHRLYRYPFIDEMASYYGWGDMLYQDIDPERGINLEAGSSLMIMEHTQLFLELYQLEMEDEIAYNPVTFRNENMDETRRVGASLGVQQDAGSLEWHSSVDWVDAQFVGGMYDGREIPLVPEYLLKAGVSWEFLEAVTAGLEGRYVGCQKMGGDYANTEENLEAYTTVDTTLSWSPVPTVSLFGAVCNIFNEQYASSAYLGYPEAGYYPSAGTTWKAGARITF